MNRLSPISKRSDAHLQRSHARAEVWRRVGRGLRRLHGLAYAVVAAGAMAAAGLQPPHVAAVEVGTVLVATAAGADLGWSPDAAAAPR
jgi:hypothetical protein